MLQDKRQEHLKFCEHARLLIERVTGKAMTTGTEVSLSHFNKLDVVAQTKIHYNDKELLQLICEHLVSKGK